MMPALEPRLPLSNSFSEFRVGVTKRWHEFCSWKSLAFHFYLSPSRIQIAVGVGDDYHTAAWKRIGSVSHWSRPLGSKYILGINWGPIVDNCYELWYSTMFAPRWPHRHIRLASNEEHGYLSREMKTVRVGRTVRRAQDAPCSQTSIILMKIIHDFAVNYQYVYTHDTQGTFLQLLIHKCHANEYNPSNQVCHPIRFI